MKIKSTFIVKLPHRMFYFSRKEIKFFLESNTFTMKQLQNVGDLTSDGSLYGKIYANFYYSST